MVDSAGLLCGWRILHSKAALRRRNTVPTGLFVIAGRGSTHRPALCCGRTGFGIGAVEEGRNTTHVSSHPADILFSTQALQAAHHHVTTESCRKITELEGVADVLSTAYANRTRLASETMAMLLQHRQQDPMLICHERPTRFQTSKHYLS